MGTPAVNPFRVGPGEFSEGWVKKRSHITIGKITYLLTPKQTYGVKYFTSTHKFIKFYGGSRSGKTFLTCLMIALRAIKYPGSHHLIARLSNASCKDTVWKQTMLPILRACERAGKCRVYENKGEAVFKNGSLVKTGGIRPSEKDRILSTEWETIFVCEANENTWEIIEQLQGRLQGSSTDLGGNEIKLKFIIDLNPTVHSSWTYKVWMKGINPGDRPQDEKIIEPKIYQEYIHLHWVPEDNKENLRDGYIETLQSMGKTRRKRFYEGDYGSFGCLMYEFDDRVHVVDDFVIPESWKKIVAIDFGFDHPFVALWMAISPDEVIYVYREWVMSEMIVRKHAEYIQKYCEKDFTSSLTSISRIYDDFVCDHDREDRATLEDALGISTSKAYKDVESGINNVRDLLERQKFKVFRSCGRVRIGFENYRRKPGTEEPIKEDDDEMDAVRYGCARLRPVKRGSRARRMRGFS